MRMSIFCCTFAADIQQHSFMAQETLDSLIQVMFTLSLPEQMQVIEQLQANVQRQSSTIVDDAVKKQLIANAEEGIAEIERGECYSNEEVMERMNQRMERSYAIAV